MAWLLLEDGSKYAGELIGAASNAVGEVVFNTGMCGYQELLTDPSYCGQIVVMTYPLIGNYGINSLDAESDKIHLKALVVHEMCEHPCNWKSEQTLDEYLKSEGITGLTGVDTRAITRHIRANGTVRGAILDHEPTEQDFINMRSYAISKPVQTVTCSKVYELPGPGKHIAVLDLGLKRGMLSALEARDCRLTVFPASTSADEVLGSAPDGILLTNGPGDPKDNPEIIETVKRLMDEKPVFGICLGFQLMALACGADTRKLKYGHRGCNHPVKDLKADHCAITSQNHGYAVLPESVPEDVEITHLNWNDHTVEGIRLKHRPAFGVQYHPEANPGPDDTPCLFDEFLKLIDQCKEAGNHA